MEAAQMLRTLEAERARGRELFASAGSLEELEAANIAVLGRKSPLGEVQRALGALEEGQRRELGRAVNEARTELADAFEARRDALSVDVESALLAADAVDMTLPGRRRPDGSLHPLTVVEDEIVGLFLRLGYRVAEGPEIEDDWHNFQALNIPEDHPARTMKDSLYVSIPGHPELLLRTETSAVQIRTMLSQPPPVYIVAPGRVYRRETPDPTHLAVFHQVEALVVDEGITFADLKGTLEAMAKGLFGEDRRIRFTPSYFPFVEPGAQIGVTCFRCGGVGCPTCRSGWIELLGAGMVHPKVLENCGYDSERYTGFAFGLGIERVAILKYEIPDIRLLIEGDVRFLERFRAA
ncbi:MAG: phenylalanine--tRNA ligase subunit alpha [Actinobacteria bacterium]|nr:MAG: phenylalanine--tRNA ligase subunit alpha [Actinomycetota bacterium]